VVIGYNNLNSLTDSTNLGVIVGTNCLNSYTESNMVNYPNNLTVAVGHNVFINLVTGYEKRLLDTTQVLMSRLDFVIRFRN
jgi:hypothetical protein